MRIMGKSLLPAFMLALSASSLSAQQLGDVKRGLAYAERICSECHAVRSSGDVSRNPAATPFRVVANQPGINERALVVFLSTPHRNMPNILVSGQDRDDLIAYILSLRRTPS